MLQSVDNIAKYRQTPVVRKTDLANQYNVVRRRWKSVAITALTILIASYVFLSFLTPRYTAPTQVMFDPRKQNVFQLQPGVGIAIDTGSVESEVALIQSFNVLRRVVKTMNLDKVPEFGDSGPGGLVSRLMSMVTGPTRDELTPDGRTSAAQILAARRLKDAVAVRRVGITYVIELSATSTDPTLAARLSDALAQAYIAEQLDARYEISQRATNWFTDRLGGLRDQLQDSERKVAQFRLKYGLVETQQGGAIDKQQVSEVSGQLVIARANTVEKRAKLDQAERATRDGNSSAVSEVLQSGVIANLRAQESEVARREADLTARYSGNHPLVVNVRAEHADIRRAIATETTRIISNFRNEYEVALKREQSLEQSLQAMTSTATGNETVKAQLADLQREYEANKALYENFLGRSKDAREQSSLDSSDSRIISQSTIPTAPSFPRKPPMLGLAAFVGLLAGIGVAFLLDYIESGFVTAEQIEGQLSLPVLAVLPGMTPAEYDAKNEGIPLAFYVDRKPLARFSESIRSVRVGVNLSNVDRQPKLVLVTSSVPGEGKSTVASSLAMSAAASGKRVLLIDGDLRHPTSSKIFGLEKLAGLVEVLSADLDPQSAIRQVSERHLDVMPAGGATKNAPDLLASNKMQSLLSAASAAYDLVVIDTPPVTAVADSLVVAPKVDKIVFVVEWERTPRDVVQRAMNLLGESRANIAGVVLNKANIRDMRFLSSYYYYSYYSRASKAYYSN